MIGFYAQKTLTLETLTDVGKCRGTDSATFLLSFDSKVCAAANVRGTISGGGSNISFPLSSLVLAFDVCFLLHVSGLLCNVPPSSRCFAASGKEVGFLGEMLSSVLNDI